jgi:spore maturation protein CgeB
MEWHVVEALRQMQIEVQFFRAFLKFGSPQNPLRKVASKLTSVMLREPERVFEKGLIRTVEQFSPSVILVIMGNQISPRTIQKVRAHTRAPIVCWCQDQMTTLGRQYLIGSEYDAVFVKDRYLQDLFSRMIRSTSFHYLPEACNPQVHRTVPLSDAQREYFGCDVMIAGSLYYYRQEILRALDGFELKVWGYSPQWLIYRLRRPRMRREVFCDDKARAASAARIALNPLHYAEVDALNCRAFELAGCGAFQICTAKPVVAEHFQPGTEIETFASLEELVEKIRHYLKHPAEAAAIAQAGQQRAHRDHTYVRRLETMFQVVGKSHSVN